MVLGGGSAWLFEIGFARTLMSVDGSAMEPGSRGCFGSQLNARSHMVLAR